MGAQLESRLAAITLNFSRMGREDYDHLLSAYIDINDLVENFFRPDLFRKELGLLAQELALMANGLNELDRFSLLCHYFFHQMGFQKILPKDRAFSESDLFICSVISCRQGHPLLLSSLYSFLALQIQLPIHPVGMTYPTLLKWVRNGHNAYIDITNQGNVLNDQDFAHILSQRYHHWTDNKIKSIDSLSAPQLLMNYLGLLVKFFEDKDDSRILVVLFSLLLKLDPNNIIILARRSLLLMKIGRLQEAFADLKHYFSFVESQQVSSELRFAFLELKQITQKDMPQPYISSWH